MRSQPGKREEIRKRYEQKLRQLEAESHAKIERIWNHTHLEVEEAPLLFEGMDLFSEASADIFGLTRTEMILTAATTGAVTGAGIDLLFAGHTLLLGGAIGAVVGGVGAYFGFDELSNVKVLGQKLGKRYLQAGPMENRNFPYILLGRALYLVETLASRSHAIREPLVLNQEEHFKERWLDEKGQKILDKHHKAFRLDHEIDKEAVDAYAALIQEFIGRLIQSRKV